MDKDLELRILYTRTLDYLKLPEIPLDIRYVSTPKRFRVCFKFWDNKDNPRPEINLVLPSEDLLVDNLPKHLKFSNNFETVVWAMFHEISHYFHWYKYRKHFDRYLKTYDHKRTHKMERIANTMAEILYKHYKRT